MTFSPPTERATQPDLLATPEPALAPGLSVWAPSQRALTAGLVTTVTLAAFEALAVGTVMPLVAGELGGINLYGWAFSGFFLGNLVGIVAAGIAIDRRGVRGPFIVGLGLFAVGLAIGGLAPSMPILVLGRIIQGAGAGAIPGVALVTIANSYDARVRPRMFAILSSAWVVPGLVGPAIAGWIGDHITWRAVFLGLLPMILVAGLITIRALARGTDHRSAGSVAEDADHFDALANARRNDSGRLVRATIVALGAGLLLATSSGGLGLLTLPLAAVGLALGVVALPGLLPAGTLRAARGLPAAVLVRGILTFAFFGAEAYLPLALVTVRGTSATEAGLALTAATISWTLGAWIQASRNEAWGGRRLVALGFVLVTVSIVAVSPILLPGVPIVVAAVAWAIGGFGMGLAYSSLSLLVLRDAPIGEQGAATAGLQLSDVLGTSLGTGLGGAIVGFATLIGLSAAAGIGAAFGVSAAVALLALVVTRRLAGGGAGVRPSVAAAEAGAET
jgi:MFS family permease